VSIRIDQATPPIIKLRTRLAIAQALKSAKVFAQVEGDCRARLVRRLGRAHLCLAGLSKRPPEKGGRQDRRGARIGPRTLRRRRTL
jgi:hypothetical protein